MSRGKQKPLDKKKHTLNINGVYRACIECSAHLHFKAGNLVLSGGVVIRPMPNTENEFIITAHRPDCTQLGSS